MAHPQHAPAAQVASAPSSGRAVQGPASTPAVSGGKAAGDALEDYFDRLDVAFANIGTSPSNAAPRLEPDEVSVGLGNLSHAQADRTSCTPRSDGELGSRSGRGIRVRRSGGRTRSRPIRQPQLADAFAALLAAEEGHASGQVIDLALPPPPAVISEEIIEEIVRRVVARLADDSMRRVVVDTAERLVREEIERIKRAASPGTTTGSGS